MPSSYERNDVRRRVVVTWTGTFHGQTWSPCCSGNATMARGPY